MKKTIELEQDDLNCIKDVVLGALRLDKPISNEEALGYWNIFPEHLKEDAIHWGLNDSVVRDNIYEWIQENNK